MDHLEFWGRFRLFKRACIFYVILLQIVVRLISKYEYLRSLALILSPLLLLSGCHKPAEKHANTNQNPKGLSEHPTQRESGARLTHKMILPSPDCQRIHNAGYDYLQLDPESKKLIQVGPVYWETAPDVHISGYLSLTQRNHRLFNSVKKIVPFSISDRPVDFQNEKFGISIFTYSRRTGVSDFTYPIDLNVKPPHPPDIAVFSEYFADASFLMIRGSFPGYIRRIGHHEIAISSGDFKDTAQRLRMPMIEYYRTNYIDGSAALQRVNCYINIDHPDEIQGFLNECLVRSLGFMQTPEPVREIHENQQKSYLSGYLGTRPSEFSEDIKFESSLSGRCLAEKYGANK